MSVTHSAFSASHADAALRFVGKSTDPKPGESGSKFPYPPNASVYREIDGDQAIWLFDAENLIWIQQPAGGTASTTWSQLADKPFETIGRNLKVVDGALAVDTADEVQQDNTRPITSAAVHTEIGNINALLALI